MVVGCVMDDIEAAGATFGAMAATFPLASIPELSYGLGLVATPATLAQAVAGYRATGIDELIVLPVNDVAEQPRLVGLLAGAR